MVRIGELTSRREFLKLGAGTAGLLISGFAFTAPVLAETRRRSPGPSVEKQKLSPPKSRSRIKAGPTPREKPPYRTTNVPLRYGTPKQAGLLSEYISEIDAQVEAGMRPSPEHPLYPGAVVLVARNGVVSKHEAYGYALKYADSDPTLLPESEWIPMRRDTIFDLASVSKLFTSLAIMQLVERGSLELDAPVARYIPAFGQNGKSEITVRQLLTHTSGLPAWLPLYSRYPTPEERIVAIYEVAPRTSPGSAYAYSDLGMIVLGKLVEETSRKTLDRFVVDNITGPLGMMDTGYNRPPTEKERIAATEYQPWTERGMVWGDVHDENAWSLGGVAGHAGVFSTAWDLAVLAQTILNGGRYGASRILEPETVQEALANQNSAFSGVDHGLGFELYQHWYMDAMATPVTAGHTGYTGTSLVMNPLDGSFQILLTNRVHPSRSWGSVNPARRAVARRTGRAVPIRIPDGEAWFSNLGDGLENTLNLPLTLPEGPKELEMELWYDTEPGTDYATVEASTDDGSSWEPLSVVVSGKGGSEEPADDRLTGWSGREWHSASFDLSRYSGSVALRLRYVTDTNSNGRGVYANRVRVTGPDGMLFDEARPGDAALWRPNGWIPASD